MWKGEFDYREKILSIVSFEFQTIVNPMQGTKSLIYTQIIFYNLEAFE